MTEISQLYGCYSNDQLMIAQIGGIRMCLISPELHVLQAIRKDAIASKKNEWIGSEIVAIKIVKEGLIRMEQ